MIHLLARPLIDAVLARVQVASPAELVRIAFDEQTETVTFRWKMGCFVWQDSLSEHSLRAISEGEVADVAEMHVRQALGGLKQFAAEDAAPAARAR